MKTFEELFQDSHVFGETDFVVAEIQKIISPLGTLQGGYRESRSTIQKAPYTDYIEVYWLLTDRALIKIIYNTRELTFEIYNRTMIVSVKKNYHIKVAQRLVSQFNEMVLEFTNKKPLILTTPWDTSSKYIKDFYEFVDLISV